MSALSELIAKYNPDELSSRQIAKLAEDGGVKVGHSTLSKCINGTHAAIPDPNTLKALSVALRIPSRRIREAVKLPRDVAGDVELPAEASQLTPRQWEAVREIIFSMVNPEGNARRRGEGVTPPTPIREADVSGIDDLGRRLGTGQSAARGREEGPKK